MNRLPFTKFKSSECAVHICGPMRTSYPYPSLPTKPYKRTKEELSLALHIRLSFLNRSLSPILIINPFLLLLLGPQTSIPSSWEREQDTNNNNTAGRGINRTHGSWRWTRDCYSTTARAPSLSFFLSLSTAGWLAGFCV